MRRPIGVQLAEASRAHPGESAEDITRRIFSNRTVREQAIVAETLTSERRIMRESFQMHAYMTAPSLTLGEIIDYARAMEAEGFVVELKWIRDLDTKVPGGIELSGAVR